MKSIINDYIEFNLVPGIVLDWILLPHTPFFKMCDKKILIKTDEAKRRNRLKQRDNISEEDINLRDNASISYNEEDFDEIINN
jgi:dephospho-CoA kinase